MDVAVRALRSPTMHYFTSPDELIKKITDTGAMNNYVKRSIGALCTYRSLKWL